MRVKVKAEGVSLAEARLVTKTFALKFLRKGIVNARIQVLKRPPEVVAQKYKLAEHPGHQVWQVWSGSKAPLVEVCGDPDVLPFVAVREAYRCRLGMRVTAFPHKGGVRMQAVPIDPHEDHGVVEGAPCNCYGTDKHEACAKSGCAVCKSKPFAEASVLRAEAEAIIDRKLDETMPEIEPMPIEDNLGGLKAVEDDHE